MIIKIDDKNQVISKLIGDVFENIEVDNIKTFKVDQVPTISTLEVLHFNPELKEFYTEPAPIIETPSAEEYADKIEAIKNKKNALKWLADNDWKVNKHTLGEWADDDARWQAYLADRAKIRAQFDEAEEILKQK